MSNQKITKIFKQLIALVLTTIVIQGCGVLDPDPIRLYPDGPKLSPKEAATLNLLASGPKGRVPFWSETDIWPQFPTGDLGKQLMPSTWMILLPPGEYKFRIRHPYETKKIGGAPTLLPLLVSLVATLEPGKYYKIVFKDNPGHGDYEIWETTEAVARTVGFGSAKNDWPIVSRIITE